MIYQQLQGTNYPLAALEYNSRNTMSKTKDGKNIVRAMAGKDPLTITEKIDIAAKPNAAIRNLVFLVIFPLVRFSRSPEPHPMLAPTAHLKCVM
jgi:hypothetical protein